MSSPVGRKKGDRAVADKKKESADVIPLSLSGKGPGCPLCGKPVEVAFRPFCSKRCADRDLGRWLTEDYRIASDEESRVEAEEIGED